MVEIVVGILLGLAAVAVLQRADERRAWAEYARVTRWHPMGTEAPTDIVVGDGRTDA